MIYQPTAESLVDKIIAVGHEMSPPCTFDRETFLVVTDKLQQFYWVGHVLELVLLTRLPQASDANFFVL